MLVQVTVAGGIGSADFDAGGWGQDVSITSPDNTPMFDILITNRRGEFLIGATNIDVQKSKIDGRYRTDVTGNTATIFNAADDGIYNVQVHLE